VPSRLPSRSQKDLYYKQKSVAKLAPMDVQIGGKWRGYEPDLHGVTMTWDGCSELTHLIPVAASLQTDDGYSWVDTNDKNNPSLPLGTSSLPSSTPQPVVGLFEWTFSLVPGELPWILAVTAATAPASPGRYFYRLTATAAWIPMGLTATETDPATSPSVLLATDDNVLYDFAVYGPGCPARGTPTAAVGGGDNPDVGADIDTSVVIACNGYDSPGGTVAASSPVIVIRDNPPTYAILTGDLHGGSGDGQYFAAATCCEYQDRVVFGATRELDLPCPYRVRWSAVGDASKITTATPGAGALDLVEFRTPIMRILPIGDALAVYSADGVAFLSRTGRSTDPFARRYVTKTRGLLAPQAVCSIGKDLHFGIFTDGWYTLGQSGEWNRVGLDEGNVTRWDREFYGTLAYPYRFKTTVSYDQYRQIVRICFVSINGNNPQVPNVWWNLDLRTNTLWPSDTETNIPTYWIVARQVYANANVTWNTVGGGTVTWDDIPGTWADYLAAAEATPAPIFGTTGGMVYQTSYSTVLQGFRVTSEVDTPILGGTLPHWSAVSHHVVAAQVGGWSVPDKLWLNYLDQGHATVQLGFEDTDGTQSLQAVDIGAQHQNCSQSTYSSHRVSMKQPAWYVSGEGPVRIQGLRAQLLPTTAEQIRPEGT